MKNRQYKLDIIPGIVIACFSIGYLCMIPSIQTFDGLGSTPLTNHFVPCLWGGILLALSLWLIFRGYRKYRYCKANGLLTKKTSLKDAIWEKREVLASFLALAIYVALMNTVGFVIMTILYVFIQILILTPRERWRKGLLPALIVAVISGCLLFYIFRYMLNVLLPVGFLSMFGL